MTNLEQHRIICYGALGIRGLYFDTNSLLICIGYLEIYKTNRIHSTHILCFQNYLHTSFPTTDSKFCFLIIFFSIKGNATFKVMFYYVTEKAHLTQVNDFFSCLVNCILWSCLIM